MFCDFIKDLNFNDRVGLVIYDTSRGSSTACLGFPASPIVDLGDEPLTYDITGIDMIQ